MCSHSSASGTASGQEGFSKDGSHAKIAVITIVIDTLGDTWLKFQIMNRYLIMTSFLIDG